LFHHFSAPFRSEITLPNFGFSVNYPAECGIKAIDMAVSDLHWHLDVPFWPDDKDILFSIAPNEVLKYPDKHLERYRKIKEADISYPIHIVHFKGKFLVLDGLHRLSKAILEEKAYIFVKIVSLDNLK
jgi:hypothetical protein